MSTLATESIAKVGDPTLTNATSSAVENALIMCGANARCVGVSSVPMSESGTITGLLGVHGNVSGFISINMSERTAIKLVEGLLQDSFGELTNQVVDGAGEIANIIVGGMKASLANTNWGFSNITVPSVILGQGYRIAYATNLDFISVAFEHEDPEAIRIDDRLMTVSISLLKL